MSLDASSTVRGVCEQLSAGLGLPSPESFRIVHKGRELVRDTLTLEENGVRPRDVVVLVASTRPQFPHFVAPVRWTLADAIVDHRIAAAPFISRASGTTLTVLPSEGRALVAMADTGCTLSVTTFQMCVLLAFNQAEVLSTSELLQITGLTDATLEATLFALTSPLHPVLVAVPGHAQRAFGVNMALRSDQAMITLGAAVATETHDQTSARRERAVLSMSLLIDCAAIRFLKRSPSPVTLSVLQVHVTRACRNRGLLPRGLVAQRVLWLASEGYLTMLVDGRVAYGTAAADSIPHEDGEDLALETTAALPGRAPATPTTTASSIPRDIHGVTPKAKHADTVSQNLAAPMEGLAVAEASTARVSHCHCHCGPVGVARFSGTR